MSFAGFKKQINKANQYVSEKMGTAEGTKMDDEFTSMEKKTESITSLVNHLVPKTKEFLHPNPAVRAKMYLNRDKGAVPHETQEGEIGDLMLKASRELSVDCIESEYASALKDVGCSLIEVSDTRNDMISHVQENFLGPLIDLENKELKDLAANMKKLHGRRLDFDCKKRKTADLKRKSNRSALDQSKQETRLAEAKFDESTALCRAGMADLLNNEVEMIHQLSQLVCALLEFHKKSADTLERSVMLLNKRVANAKSGTGNLNASAKGTNPLADDSVTASKPKPCCRAKADYQKKNDDELSFSAGDLIMLSSKIDDEWYEGVLEGKIGKVPTACIRIIADVPEDEEDEEKPEEEEAEELEETEKTKEEETEKKAEKEEK